MYGHPVVRFALSNTPAVRVGGGEQKLNIPAFSCPLPSPAFTLQETFIVGQDSKEQSGILLGDGLVIRQLKEDGAQEPVGRMHFHLINFKHYWGEPLAQSHGDTVRGWKGRAVFLFGKYIVTLDRFREASERLEEAHLVNGYGFTHVGSMCRVDNKLFDPDKGAEALECLGWFFSFANGSYCPCVLPTGYRYLKQPLWQQWNMPHVSLNNSNQNWFSAIRSLECFQAADCFYKCWQDEAKRQWLKTAIGLYLASTRTTDNIELALANAQIPLEMLTWVALMEENSLMSEESFEKLPAADKIRALSFWLNVSTAIPHRLEELRQAMPGVDLPKAIVDLRNLLIHQTPQNRRKYLQVPEGAFYHAWQVNLWYIELTLLKLTGYSGHYFNRIGKPSEKSYDVLPWTK